MKINFDDWRHYDSIRGLALYLTPARSSPKIWSTVSPGAGKLFLFERKTVAVRSLATRLKMFFLLFNKIHHLIISLVRCYDAEGYFYVLVSLWCVLLWNSVITSLLFFSLMLPRYALMRLIRSVIVIIQHHWKKGKLFLLLLPIIIFLFVAFIVELCWLAKDLAC